MQVRQVYGISLERYNEIMRAAEGKCAICGRISDRLTLDHCHDSLHIRGALCTQCNTGLGMFRDNVAFLLSAVDYLEANRKVARLA